MGSGVSVGVDVGSGVTVGDGVGSGVGEGVGVVVGVLVGVAVGGTAVAVWVGVAVEMVRATTIAVPGGWLATCSEFPSSVLVRLDRNRKSSKIAIRKSDAPSATRFL